MAGLEVDAIVLGAGPAGEVAAGRLAEAGLEVALIESHLVGGECSFYACMPSKALLRPAELLGETRRVPGVGGNAELDVEAILARRDEVIHDLDDSGQLPWIEKRGIELIRGSGRLVGERELEVGGRRLRARRAVVIATGSGAAMPPIEGLDDVDAWNNREATTSKRVPASMVILGGGPVGCELAQAWSSLGTAVTLVEAEERLLPREEPFAGDELAEAMRAGGVDVRTGVRAERVAPSDSGIVVEFDSGAPVQAEQILVALGRRPHSEGIGLEEIGVETDENGFLETDEGMRVGGREWLYAIGDVNGRPLLTHAGKYQAWVAVENVLGRTARAEAEALGAPRVAFTDPQIAAVGLTLFGAEKRGLEARAVDVATDRTAGASFHGRNTGGTARLVIDDGPGTIVGATFTGFETAEMIHAATIAIVAEVPISRLRHALPAFPTRSEIWLKLVEAAGR